MPAEQIFTFIIQTSVTIIAILSAIIIFRTTIYFSNFNNYNSLMNSSSIALFNFKVNLHKTYKELDIENNPKNAEGFTIVTKHDQDIPIGNFNELVYRTYKMFESQGNNINKAIESEKINYYNVLKKTLFLLFWFLIFNLFFTLLFIIIFN